MILVVYVDLDGTTIRRFFRPIVGTFCCCSRRTWVVHDAINIVNVKSKEGKEISGNAFDEMAAQAIILECISHIIADVGSGDFRVALNFGAFPALRQIIKDCSYLHV